MLLMTTNKRVSSMMSNTRKMKNSKAYIKEVNKSTRALYKDIRDEVTGGRFNAMRASVNSMKEEARMQKRGFYTNQFKKMLNDNRLVQLTKEYSKSASKALKTGKLYRRENDIFDNMMNQQSKIMSGGSSEDIVQSWDIPKTNATYDAAKATISSMNANAHAQNEFSRLQTAETKMGFARMSTVFSVGTQQQVQVLQGIGTFMNDVLKGKLDEGLTLDRSRNALLTEIRDLTKKMVINNDTYQQMSIEKDKSALDLALEGRFKDALVKGGENIIKEFDKNNLVQIMGNMLPMALQQAISNPFGFIKDIFLSENKTLKRLKGSTDVKKIANDKLMQMLGSNDPLKSRTAKALLVGNTKSMDKLTIGKDYNKGPVQWSGYDRQALIEVIPTYLRKILAALTKKDELIYDYHNAEFETVAQKKKKISDFTNREISGSNSGAAMLTDFYRAEEKKRTGRNTNYSFAAVFNMFVKDMALSPYPTSIKSVLFYDYRAYKRIFPNTPIDRDSWTLLSISAKAMYTGTGEANDKFVEQMGTLEKNINKYKEENDLFAAQLSKDSALSGYSSFVNGSGTLSGMYNSDDNAPIKRGKNRGKSTSTEPKQSDADMLDELLKVQNIASSNTTATSKSELLSAAGNDQSAYAKLLDRGNFMNAKDFENSGFKIHAWHFRQWLDKKHGELSDEMKAKLTEFANKQQFEKIIPHVKDFGLYLDQVRFEHMMNTNELTSGEKKKLKELKDLQDRHTQFNSMYDGLERSIDGITKDPAKLDAMSGLVKKMAVAGGLAGVTGAMGLVPFAGAMGLPGIMAMTMGGIGLTVLSNREAFKEMLMGGMTPEERANAGKITSFIFSKSISGLGVGAMTALAAPLLGAGPVLAPLLAATAGIAVAMNSEKSGFKKFFFGEEADTQKTFFQLFKTKMLGDGQGDDGLFGRFLNPVIEKTSGLFDKFNKGLEDKILKPLGDKFKTVVEKLDASSIGQKFKDAMGFSVSEFGQVMKKNVWTPITKSIFGGIKKLFGWGRKHKDNIQDGQKADLDVGDSIAAMAASPPPTPPTGDPAAAAGSGVRRRMKQSGQNIYGGAAVLKGRGGVLAADMLTAERIPLGDRKDLIGKGMSDPSKHYYSQFDPQYKDIPMTGSLTIEIKKQLVENTKSGATAGSIGDLGCGIMAAAMVMSRFGKVENEDKKKEVTPGYITKTLLPLAKPYTSAAGINYEYFKALANKYNMEYTMRKANSEIFSTKEIKQITAGGKGVIVVLTTQKSYGNHYVVITGINGDTVYYDDPARKRNLMMSYDEFCNAAVIAMALTKTKGLFGFLGKILKGLGNWLSGDSHKSKKARQWHIRRELVDRMTREEWQKYRNRLAIPADLIDKLKTRNPMFTHADGSKITDDKGNLITDRFYADTLMKQKIEKDLAKGSGSGAKKPKSEKPKNAINKIPDKSTYKFHGGAVPKFLNNSFVIKNEDHYRSLMLAANLHQTDTVATMLGAIYTKLSEQEVTIYNGTNGVAYNVESLKRMIAIKHYGSVSEANKAIGPIDKNSLANARFFGGRKGFFGKILTGAIDAKNYIKSKTVDPIVLQAIMFKQSVLQIKDSIVNGIGNFLSDVGDVFRGFVDGIGGFFKGAGKIISGALQGIGTTISGAVKGLGSAIGGTLKGIGSAISGAIGGIGTIFSTTVNAITDTIQGIPNLIGDSIGALTKSVTALGVGTIQIAGALGGTAYGAVKTVVKDIWRGGGEVMSSLGRGATGVKNFFTGGDARWTERDNVKYVRVLGGHIDTVGTVGAVDRDSYVNELKTFKRTNKNHLSTKGTSYRIGGGTLKNNAMNNNIDSEQDKASSVQDKQTELLQQLVNKPAGGGMGGNGKEPTWWEKLLPLLALLPDMADLIKGLWNKFMSPGSGDDMGEGNGDTTPGPNSGDLDDRNDYWAGTTGRVGESIARNAGKYAKMGRNLFRAGRIGVKKLIRGGKKLWKKGGAIVTGTKGLWNKFFGPKVEPTKMLGWNGKTTQALEYSGNLVRGSVSDIPLNRSLALPKADTVMDSKNIISKSVSLLENVLTKVVESAPVKYFVEKYQKGMSSKLVKGIKKFVERFSKDPRVAKAATGKWGKNVVEMLIKANPYINATLFVYDCVSGWNDADVYFNVPEPQLTLNMKLTASLTKAVQGLLTAIPQLMIFCVVPPEAIASFVYEHWIGTGEQKKQLEDAQKATKLKYQEYRTKTEASGKKAATFDRWLNGETNETKSLTDRLLGFLHLGNDTNETNYGNSSGYGVQNNKTNNKASTFTGGQIITGAGSGMITKNAAVTSGGSFYFPMAAKLISSRALLERVNPVTGKVKPHPGIDIAASVGTPVYAIKAGKVTKSGWENSKNQKQGYGLRIEITHNPGRSLYAHLSKTLVSVGQVVQKGELIGYSGNSGSSTGPHLHFGVFDGANNVINPEKIYPKGSFVYKPGTDMKSAVYGNRFAIGSNTSPTNKAGIASTMYSQNFNLNMGVGGDNLTLAQVGCGPVTTNLFLQESGVKEPLYKTAQALRFKRDTDSGFDSKTLSNYITSRRVSNKVLTTADKTTLIYARFGIVFAKRNSIINSLDDHHALFMKNVTNIGAVLFDPSKETYKFYSWSAILDSSFEFIIPAGTGNVSGPRTESSILSNSRSNVDMVKHNAIMDISKKVMGARPKTVIPDIATSPDSKVSGNLPSSNNINLEAKLDTIITLLTHIAANTLNGTSKTEVKMDGAKNAISTVIENIMNSAAKPKQILENDAWWISKKRIARGGL